MSSSSESQTPEGRVLRVAIAGITGWAGSALAKGVNAAEGMTLVGGVSRSAAGGDAGQVLGVDTLSAPIFRSVAELMTTEPDVVVEYTKPNSARGNVQAALEGGAHVVIGTSGLAQEDFDHLDEVAKEQGLGVLACGNFSLTAVLMMRFSEIAARWIKQWEILDYAHAGKVDAPSGTARELAHRLSKHGPPELQIPIEDVQGHPEARGADVADSRVHSIRLPSYIISIESLFGLPDERLTIRHDAGASAEPYVGGALLAIQGVGRLVGVHRGLDVVMEE